MSLGYKRKDFQNDNEVKWCPGCGDFAILKSLTNAWCDLEIPRENYLVVSGIGCSSRFPYYTQTYGFHTLHGRSLTVALGAKVANPDLSVWVVTGDGDSLSIGGNHFIHALRRNPNINIILFNNEIYGLTKGQTSPTSQTDLKTKSTPFGSIDRPMNPLSLALTAGATFAARVMATDGPMMRKVFTEAANHRGASVVEVYTNCIIFNDGVFEPYAKKSKATNTIELSDGELIATNEPAPRYLSLDNLSATLVDDQNLALRHQRQAKNRTLAQLLAGLSFPEFPLPVGVFYQEEAPVYEEQLLHQRRAAATKLGKPTLDELLHAGETWQI